MLKKLIKWFGPKAYDTMKSCPEIKGHVTVQLFNKEGKVCGESTGYNIWTLTGREYLTELIALQTFSTIEANRGLFRNDRIAYIGMGTGSQVEAAEVNSLVYPIGIDTGTQSGTYLTALDAPATFPATSTSTTNTSVRFSKEFTTGDYTANGSVVLTEAGLFTDGDPTNNFAIEPNIQTGLADSYAFSPVAYKTFDPITKTSDFTMKVVWEVRFI